MRRMLSLFAFGVYLYLVLRLTLVMFGAPHPGANLVPMRTIAHDWHVGGRSFVVNFLGNLGVFVPLGFFLPLIRPRPTLARHVAVLGLLLSGSIEAAQYLSGLRVADVDDVLLNATGGLIGYGIFVGLRRARAAREEARGRAHGRLSRRWAVGRTRVEPGPVLVNPRTAIRSNR